MGLGRWRPNWRAAAVLVALLGTAVASAGGAWAVHDSWEDHQRAVDRALTEYALFAARAFGEQVTYGTVMLRVRATALAYGTAPPEGVVSPTLGEFSAAAERVLGPGVRFADDPWRGYFRIALRDGGYQATGAAADSTIAPLVRDAVRARLGRMQTDPFPPISIIDRGGTDVAVSYALQRSATGQPTAVYGYTSERNRTTAAVADDILERDAVRLLPPSILPADWTYTDTISAHGLIAVRIFDARGRERYRSREQFTSTASADYVFRALSTSRFRATLHPDLIARLRAGLVDSRRRGLQFALSALSVLLAGAVVLYLRRERELAEARRDFVASVSHELRTPLAQIRMFSETLILRRENSEEERMRWLGIIGREARRLGDLVENILLFSHIDAARIRLEPERTDLGELVEEAVEAYVPVAAGREMRIVADAPSRIYAVVDPRAVRQVVVNLLDNALKYGPAGQTVRVELERDGGFARLSVADEGPGVPEADRVRLFDPFVRLTPTGGATGGSGIGLAVVRSLVAQHGGTVVVDDAPGGGALFLVSLPLAVLTPGNTGTHAVPHAVLDSGAHRTATAGRAANG